MVSTRPLLKSIVLPRTTPPSHQLTRARKLQVCLSRTSLIDFTCVIHCAPYRPEEVMVSPEHANEQYRAVPLPIPLPKNSARSRFYIRE